MMATAALMTLPVVMSALMPLSLMPLPLMTLAMLTLLMTMTPLAALATAFATLRATFALALLSLVALIALFTLLTMVPVIAMITLITLVTLVTEVGAAVAMVRSTLAAVALVAEDGAALLVGAAILSSVAEDGTSAASFAALRAVLTLGSRLGRGAWLGIRSGLGPALHPRLAAHRHVGAADGAPHERSRRGLGCRWCGGRRLRGFLRGGLSRLGLGFPVGCRLGGTRGLGFAAGGGCLGHDRVA